MYFSFKLACKPIKKVEKALYRLSNGKVNSEIEVGGGKQFQEMENNLNKINENYMAKEELIKKTNLEYEKYVPKQFAKFLGKNSILELELGNQVQKEVTTLFVDIHNSTSVMISGVSAFLHRGPILSRLCVSIIFRFLHLKAATP